MRIFLDQNFDIMIYRPCWGPCGHDHQPCNDHHPSHKLNLVNNRKWRPGYMDRLIWRGELPLSAVSGTQTNQQIDGGRGHHDD